MGQPLEQLVLCLKNGVQLGIRSTGGSSLSAGEPTGSDLWAVKAHQAVACKRESSNSLLLVTLFGFSTLSSAQRLIFTAVFFF